MVSLSLLVYSFVINCRGVELAGGVGIFLHFHEVEECH